MRRRRPGLRRLQQQLEGLELDAPHERSCRRRRSPKPTTAAEGHVIAKDYSFTVPSTVCRPGYVDVTLENQGKQDHQLQIVKLGRSTFDQFKAAAITTDIGAVKPGAVFVGGPNDAAPGKSTTATVKLDPGLYAVACFIPGADGKPHAAKGMFGEFQVAPLSDSIDTAPKATATIILGDFSFTLPTGFTGKGEVDISNQGTQVHELNLFKLDPGKTVAQAKAFLLTPPGTPPPAGPPPSPRSPVWSGSRRRSTRG